MQNRKIARILLCVLVLALCAGILPGNAAAKEGDEIYPVFDLSIDTDEGLKAFTAFCVKDPATKCVYLVTTAEAAQWADEGHFELSGAGYSERAEYLKTVGLMAYFWAPGLDEAGSFTADGPLVKTVLIPLIGEDKNGERVVVMSDPQSLSGWDDYGHYWLGGQLEETTNRLGAPVLKDEIGLVVGMLTRNEDNVLAVLALEGTVYPEDCAVVDEEGKAVGYNAGGSGGKAALTTGVTVGAVLTVLAIVAVVVVLNKKNGKSEESAKKSDSGTKAAPIREATVPMKHNEMASGLVDFPSTQPVRGGSSAWQITCIRGPLEGKVYPLYGTLTIGRAAGNDIAFPENTQGVSGKHCRVTTNGSQVMLQDLNATFGTYFGMDQKAKLKPNMDYKLNSGDVFVLAEGGPAFRLEKRGAEKAKFSVRNGSGMVYRPNGDGEITFGRGPANVVAFDQSNGSVSGKHCKVFMKENALYLMDLGSTNGTFFNENQRLKPNTAYKVANGTKFFLVDERNTFAITVE